MSERPFRMYFLVGQPGDRPGKVLAAKGTITYNADDTVTVQLPGRAPVGLFTQRDYRAWNDLSECGCGRRGDHQLFQHIRVPPCDLDEPPTALFLVASASRPSPPIVRQPQRTYNTAGAVFSDHTRLPRFSCRSPETATLMADFDAGTISGTLLTTDLFEMDLVGDPLTEDLLELTFLLQNGRITPSGFTRRRDGHGPDQTRMAVVHACSPALSQTAAAEGAFYGEEAGRSRRHIRGRSGAVGRKRHVAVGFRGRRLRVRSERHPKGGSARAGPASASRARPKV